MQTIAVDIDEVLLPHFQDVINYYNKHYGTNLTLADNHAGVVANWKAGSREKAIKRVQKFFETDDFKKSEPFEEAKYAVRQLANRYRLIVVTGRDTIVRETTNNWLNQHFKDLFDEVHFTNMYSLDGNARTKLSVCKNAGVNWLIDDSYDHIIEVTSGGIGGILFGVYPWNINKPLPNNAVRAKNWQAVLEYFSVYK